MPSGFLQRWQGKIRTSSLWIGSGGITFRRQLLGFQDGITAHAGGTKAAATVLTARVNRISVCATNGDSLLMPPAMPYTECVIIQDGAANAQVFGAGTDTIDAVATATGVVLSAAKRATFYCTTAGAWQSQTGVKAT